MGGNVWWSASTRGTGSGNIIIMFIHFVLCNLLLLSCTMAGSWAKGVLHWTCGPQLSQRTFIDGKNYLLGTSSAICDAELKLLLLLLLLLLPDPYRHLNKYMFISNACLFGCCLATIYGRRMDGIPIPSHQTCTSQRWYRISQWRIETAKRSSWRR